MLTAKELMLIQDNMKICQNTSNFLSSCAQGVTDTKLRDLCNTMATDHKNDVQILSKYITNPNFQ